jgi:hypothetical protein
MRAVGATRSTRSLLRFTLSDGGWSSFRPLPWATSDAESGAASVPGVSTTGWASGAYTITVTYAGTSTGTTQCAASVSTASLTVTAPGQFAFGYGFYTPAASVGATSFGFVVSPTKHGTSTTYRGALGLVTPGKWLFHADVTSFGLTSTTQGGCSAAPAACTGGTRPSTDAGEAGNSPPRAWPTRPPPTPPPGPPLPRSGSRSPTRAWLPNHPPSRTPRPVLDQGSHHHHP